MDRRDGDPSSDEDYKWRKSDKMYHCTGCGYESVRKSNVGRHYWRIHENLKKPTKPCPCKIKFPTKWAYYAHCHAHHPELMNSRFITTQKYKIGLEREPIRSLRNKQACQVFRKDLKRNSESSCSDDILSESSETEKTTDSTQSLDSYDKENHSPYTLNWSDNDMSEELNDIQVPDREISLSIAHLPLKKRFGHLTKAKCLVSLNIQKCTSVESGAFPINNNDLRLMTHSVRNIDEDHRAYFSQIDFDDLDAMLSLTHLKETNH